MKNTNVNDEFLRKRKERQRKKRKRRLITSFIVFVVFALITCVILSLTVLFPINSLSAKGSKIYTSKQIINASGVAVGDNLFTVSQTAVLNTLKEKLPFVQEIKFKRTLPDTLEIVVTDAKEYACYNVDGKFYTVSKDGWVLEKYNKQPKNVLLIICEGAKCTVGKQIEFSSETGHNGAQEIINLLEQNKIETNYVDITDEINLKAKIDGRFIVNFGTANSLEQKVKHLKSMVESIEKGQTGRINLSMWSSKNTQGTFVKGEIK